MSAGEIECSVLNFDFIKQCNNHGAQVNIIRNKIGNQLIYLE